eukprot:31183-Pelagococcus_subviridis.AAC.4
MAGNLDQPLKLSISLDKPLDEIIASRRSKDGGGHGGKVRSSACPAVSASRSDSPAPISHVDATRPGPHPSRIAGGVSVADIANAPSGERTLKVSSTTPPKKLAGSIALVCDGGCGEAPLLLPLGAACVNQATKAIAIARRDLLRRPAALLDDAADDDEWEPTFLSCFPGFRDDSKRAVSMQCDKEAKAPWAGAADATLTIASGTNPATLAGAIAGKVRQGMKVAARACGADAVSNAVFAVARAREYLADDGIDVYFVPEFDKEIVRGEGEETRTVIVFRICKAAGSAPTPLVADEEE